MAQWRAEPQFKKTLFRMHMVSLGAAWLPGGQWWFPKNYLMRLKAEERVPQAIRFVAFQQTWFTARTAVMIVTALLVMKLQIPETSEDLHIIKESADVGSALQPMDRQERREFMSRNRDLIWREAMKKPEIAEVFLIASVGFTIAFLFWMFSFFSTLISLLNLNSEKMSKFALTLPFFESRLIRKIERPE